MNLSEWATKKVRFQERGHDPQVQDLTGNQEMVMFSGLPELGTSKASTVKGYWSTGLQMPHKKHGHLRTTAGKRSRSQHTQRLVESIQ